MPQTIKVKLDERKVVLARDGNIDREELTVKIKEQGLEILDNWEHNRILGKKVEVNYELSGSFGSSNKTEDWPVSIHKGWFQNNVLLMGNGQGKGIIPPQPVIGSFGYRVGGIVTLEILATIAIGIVWGIFKGKIKMPFKKVQPKTEINSPLNNWGIADKQS